MLKITALNEVQSKENEEDNVNAITKEAQEQFALNEYNRALQLLIEGNRNEALNVFLDLLDTKLLDEVKKPPKQDGHARPMLSLKYACYKNIANIQVDLGNYHEAVDNYWQAINLDDTDVMIWYKIGTLAVNKFDLEEACFAFRQGLKCNQNHWPCLDRLITVLYAIPDYMNCLMFISLALEKDPSYTKGLVFYKEILSKVPSFSTLASSYFELPVDSKYDEKVAKALLDEATELSEKWISLCKTDKSSLSNLNLEKPLESLSWVELGEKMVSMIKHMNDNDINLLSCIVLADSEQLETLISTFCSGKEIENHNDVPQQQENGFADEKQIFGASQNNELENGNQSCSNEFQITEKLCTDDSPMDSCDESQIKIETNGCAEKLNSEDKDEESVANEECKLDEKVSNHLLENGNANTNLKARESQRQKKVKKRRRSSLCILQEWHWSSSNTKRSSRISNRKDCEKDGVEETLKRMFPPALLPDNIKFSKEDALKNSDSMDTMDAYYAMLTKENNSTEDSKSTASFKANSPSNEGQVTYFGLEQEFLEVRDFINEYSGKSNMITLITKFVEFLCTKWNYKWPSELAELYIQLYLYVKKYTPKSSPFEYKTDDYIMKLHAEAKLLYCELLLDKWLVKRATTSRDEQSEKSGVALMSEDLGYVIFASTDDNLSDAYLLRRMLWLKANLFLYQGDVEVALKILELLLCHIQESQSDSHVRLDNCKFNATISAEAVQKTITLIKRSKQFSRIRQLYEEKNHEEVSGILKDTFFVTKQINEFLVHTDKTIDRIEHFRLLLDSLWQLRQFEDCYVWAEACFNESWQNYLNTIGIDPQSCENEAERKKWVDSILYTLKMLDDCVSEVSTFVVQYLQESRRSRLVKNLVHFVSHQLEVMESTQSVPIFSVLPWILLHYILQYEEDRGRARSISRQKTSDMSLNSESNDNDCEIPASMVLLFKAHAFLGRHGWCCVEEGRLLLFIVKSIIPKLNFPLYAKIKAKLKEPLEQVVFCLYGHPFKVSAGVKQRPKYLEDHTTQHMPLTWDMCQILLEFYKPETLPSYDAKKIDSISSDTLDLFKKLVAHVPKDSDSSVEPSSEMYAYLKGNRADIPQVKVPLNGHSSYIYYFIADYYFKNQCKQSWLKASKYYVFDLCQHSSEFNSWAGLAMSTSTLMETWLNNFEPNISEEKYLDKAQQAQRSYQRAVDLEPSHLTIWTEYGNFLYTVHSFCSRLLKQESDSLNMQRFEVLENQKDEMLNKAKHCFSSADNIYNTSQGVDEPQDERWLYQYMLGKVAEKKNEEPPIFLQHYLQAGDRLFQNNAQYPKRVSHSNPPHLSIEALEVYYRIYASILKYLEQHEGKPMKKSLALMLNTSLKKCLKLPFVSYDCTFYKVPTEQLVPSTKVRSQEQQQWPHKKSNQSGVKRRNDEFSSANDNRAKMARYSESDLKRDVGSLINDLIMEVCDRLSPKKEISEQCAVIKFASSASSVASMDRDVEMEIDEAPVPKPNCTEDIDDASKKNSEDPQKEGKDQPKKCNNKSDKLLNRRDSQESSTTTQTSTSGTNNTSSDSSSSSSSDDSSDSSSSSDSDSESASSDTEKKAQAAANENALATDREVNELIEMCLAGLEQCILRFPEHYKSVYRLAYFYFNNRTFKDVVACKQLLLATYPCRFHPNQKIQGLFADRKNNNFFNGIWRIPVQEIDRPGSFASHMSRCVSFLMQVLKSCGDSRMLTELCVQLHKVPDADKKYLRDNEREQLACQALTLCIQCLRVKIKSTGKDASLTYEANVEAKLQVLLDIYHTNHTIQKHVAEHEAAAMPQLKRLMEEGYIAYSGHPNLSGNVFEIAKNCCKQHLKPKNKPMGMPNNIPNIPATITPSTSSLTVTPVVKMPGTAPRKSQKNQGPPKPRGRPPGDKLSNPNRSSFKSTLNDIPTSQANAGLAYGNNPMNPYIQQALLRPEFLAAMFGSSIDPSAIDAAMQYLSSMSAAPGLNFNYNNPAAKPFGNPAPTTSTTTTSEKPLTSSGTSNMLGSIKARPDVSITPVMKNPHPKLSQSKAKRSNEAASSSRATKPQANMMTAPEISLLKQPSQAHQRVPEHGLLNQAALNLLEATSKSSTIFPPTSQTSITPVQSLPKIPRVSQMNPPTMQHPTQASITPVKTTQQPSTSLQHKLLSSKHHQPTSYHSSVITSAPTRKEEPVKPYYSNPRQKPLGDPNDMSMLSNLASISVNPLQSEILKSLQAPMPYTVKKSTPKASKKSASSVANAAAYSMKNLSQDIANPAGFSHKKSMQNMNLSAGYPMKYPTQDLSHSSVFSHKKFPQDSVDITPAYSTKKPDMSKLSVKKSMQDLHHPGGYPMKKKIPEAHSSAGYSMPKSVQDVNNMPGISLKKSGQDINNMAGMSLKKPAQEVNNPAAYSVLNRLQQHSHLEIIPQANRSRQAESMNAPVEFSPVNNAPKPINFMNSDSVTMYELPKQKPSASNNSSVPPRTDKPPSASPQKDVASGKVEIITLDD